MSKTDNKSKLPSSYTMALYESYQVMIEASIAVKTALNNDLGYPVYIPTYGATETDNESELARKAAIDSIIQLFPAKDGEQLPEAGILCASPETVLIIDSFNKTKNDFKDSVMAIRKYQAEMEVPASRITKLINDEVLEKGYRSEDLQKAMSTAGISSLNLKRCYAQIRIMPPGLDVFSWTWATTHSRIKQVSITEALELAKSLPNKEASEAALDLLGQCGPGERLVKKVKLANNQLRANYAFIKDGKITRKSCPISGVVIAQQTNMPRKLWRDNPALLDYEVPHLPRVSGIGNEVFIKALSLYRYAG